MKRAATKRKSNRNSIASGVLSSRPLNSYGVLAVVLCFLAAVSAALLTQPTAHASNPSTGSINLNSAAISWQGSALAGGATGDAGIGLVTSEEMCVEGVSCDTYTLAIEGTPQDWINANKLVHVHLGWTVTAQDFDVYIHKGDLNGPVVANSGNGATNGILGREDADLDPARPSVGTGTFAVHVVYWSATAAEQYTGTVSVENVPAAPRQLRRRLQRTNLQEHQDSTATLLLQGLQTMLVNHRLE